MSAPSKEAKKGLVGRGVTIFVALIIIVLLFTLVSSCSRWLNKPPATRTTTVTRTQVPAAQSSSPGSITFTSPIPVVNAIQNAITSPQQAAPIGINTVCAPFALNSQQLCSVEEGKDSGFMGMAVGTPAGTTICLSLAPDPAGTPEDQKVLKEMTLLFANGKIAKQTLGDPMPTDTISAVKIVPRHAVTFTYMLSTSKTC